MNKKDHNQMLRDWRLIEAYEKSKGQEDLIHVRTGYESGWECAVEFIRANPDARPRLETTKPLPLERLLCDEERAAYLANRPAPPSVKFAVAGVIAPRIEFQAQQTTAAYQRIYGYDLGFRDGADFARTQMDLPLTWTPAYEINVTQRDNYARRKSVIAYKAAQREFEEMIKAGVDPWESFEEYQEEVRKQDEARAAMRDHLDRETKRRAAEAKRQAEEAKRAQERISAADKALLDYARRLYDEAARNEDRG